MRSYEDLVREASEADVDGWDFGWLDGRASEERPPWGFARLLARTLATVDSALDIDTGGGEVLDQAPRIPPRMLALEGWPPNLQRARERLGPRGVEVLQSMPDRPWPVADASVALVSSRHPVRPDWLQIVRVLEPGGVYLAQHVGPASAFALIERFLGPQPEARKGRDPERERHDAAQAGLVVDEIRTATCRMEFHDVGAVVWILRACVWWVPDFTVARYEGVLRELDAQMRHGRPFVAHSTRHLIRAHRPGSEGAQ